MTTEKARKGKPTRPAPEPPMEWERADPTALEQFDPATKTCTMNCGKHALDPRSYKEFRFMCDDCECHAAPVATVSVSAKELAALRLDAERYRWLRERSWYIDNVAHVLGLIPPRKPWADRLPQPDWDEVEDALDALISGQTDYVSPYA